MAPRTRRPKAEQRERIVHAAAELFAERGYHGTGIEELSHRVELGRGALYHHIDNKESLLFEICSTNAGKMVALAESLVQEQLDPEERLRRLVRALMRNIAENVPEWTVFFRDHIALTGTRREEVMKIRAHFEDALAATISLGQRNGGFRLMDPVIVKGMLGMFNYSYLWLDPGGRLSPEEIADIWCDLLLGGLALPPLGKPGAATTWGQNGG